ncbi:hypothetical protein GQ53DRAFT_4360 [Thozetella sp. PMI_491]|nr:hypothetical protein GQ53DRAFT_4360 [Thozetella sp. PMI_491]
MSSVDPSDTSDLATGDSPARARRACSFCSRRKIRCLRELPACSSCKLNKRQCSYQKLTPVSSEPSPETAVATNRHEPDLPYDREERNRVAIRYLDHTLFLQGPAPVSLPLTATAQIPSYAKALVGDGTAAQQIARRYHELVHPWIPIVSKRKVYNHLLNPLLPPRVDAVFLLLCMKTLAFPGDGNPFTPEYRAAVRLFSEIQQAGILSGEALQGCILLGAYEHGHSMYPSAHVTVGTCIKLATALGMNWRTFASGQLENCIWIDKEEGTRTWWSIYLLEQLGRIGNPQQPSLIADPELTAPLPCTEEEWSGQVPIRAQSTLLSPPESLGRYAGVVQASYLLSRVFRHVTDISVPIDFRRQEVEQLDNTLHALIRYSESNQGTLYSIICYQTALSFCGLYILYAPYLEVNPQDPLHQKARAVCANAASVALEVARIYLSPDTSYLAHGDIPAFVAPWLYKTGAWFIQEESLDDLAVVERALQKLDTKWRAAGTYLQLLAARRVIRFL